MNTKETSINLKNSESNEYPDTIKNYYAAYEKVLKQYYPQYTLSEIKKDTVDNSKFFSFNINTTKNLVSYPQPNVTFQNDKSSFYILLPDNIDNEILKNIILCTIMSIDNTIGIDSANELMQNLSNSFNGSNNSNIITTTNYKLYISSSSGLYSRYLNVISILEINPPINKSKYIQATNELFNGELNKDTNVYIKGTILGIYDLGGTLWGLEISNGGNIYYVYYIFDHFIDCFEIGDTYTFYGQIVAIRKGYAGSLRLDYFSSEE